MISFRSLLNAFALLLVLATAPVWAQTEQVNYDTWEQVATRAEESVANNAASIDAFEKLRADLSVFRDRFLQGQGVSDPRLATLQSQLDALGPVSDSGEEPEELAQRRADLQRQISELTAPARRAEEAYNRADGLIKEIDEIIRSRQTVVLLTRGAEPLDVRLWPKAFEEAMGTLGAIASEVSANWNNQVRRAEFYNGLPVIAGMLLFALFFLFRMPRLIDRLGLWLRNKTRRGTGVWTTLLSLLRIALPVAGLFALTQALVLTGLLGSVGESFAAIFPALLFVVLLARWLAAQTFSSDEDVRTIVLSQQRRTEARYYVNVLSWLLALDMIVKYLEDTGNWTDVTVAIVLFPIHVICGLLLFRLGQILSTVGQEQPSETDGAPSAISFTSRLARLLGRGAMVIGIVAPVLSAIGYMNIAQATIFPDIITLGLFAFLLICQRVVSDVYLLTKGQKVDESESFLPVISGTVLTLIAVPLLALIWGARVADLTELWARFQAGFSFGETRISPIDFLTFVAVFTIGYGVTRLLQSGLRGSVLPKTKIDQGGQNAIVSGTGYLGIFLAALVAITTAGIDLTALAFVAGALSVGIGFGLQNIVQNFVSGIILLVERPISEGDWIEVNGQQGTVRDISVRSTRIETFDRTDVIIPNADLVSNSVTNYTRGNVIGRLIVEVGVAYGTDTRKVEDILYKIARNHEMVLMNPEPFVHFKGFGADSLDFDVRMILRDVTKKLIVRTEVNHQIAETFAKEGIEIPFAQRDIWLRNPEALPGHPKSKPGPDTSTPEKAPS
jgi:potassium-dependent mechanosensitive channel